VAEPLWKRRGFRSEYAYRKSKGDKSASGTPGATRARRAKGKEPTPPPRVKGRGQFGPPTERGTREMETAGRKRLVQALKKAPGDVLIEFQGDVEDYHARGRQRWGVSTGRISTKEVLQAIENAEGDVDAAIGGIVEQLLPGVTVNRIDVFRIKELGK
jgi:hypothetical protein